MSKALLLAIMAVATLANAVLGAIKPLGMSFVGNQGQPSIATAMFVESPITIENSVPIEFVMYLPGTPADYSRDLRCFLEMSMDSYRPAQVRVLPIAVSVARTAYPQLVYVAGGTVLNSSDVLGKFQFACEFTAPAAVTGSFELVTSCKAKGENVDVKTTGRINSWSSAFSSFETNMGESFKETVFSFRDLREIGKSIDVKSFKITNSNPDGTSATSFKFHGPERSRCLGYWNNVLRQTFSAEIASDGNSVNFNTSDYWDPSSTFSVICPSISGFAQNPTMPSLLKAVFSSTYGKLNTFGRVYSDKPPTSSLVMMEVSE